MNLKQLTPDRFTDSRILLHETPDRKLLVKVFLGEDKSERRELEARKMIHWKAAGFHVPALIDLQVPEVTDPHLVMEFIPGETLKTFLRTADIAIERRLSALADLFSLNYRRHLLVRSQGDLLLIHTDPNTDNIIVSGGGYYFIDFEHPSKRTDVSAATANEVGTFARRAIRDLGVEHGRSVVERLLAAYQFDREIFDQVEALTFDRPFQLLHRIKDRLVRLKNSRAVTRYDVADFVRSLRGVSTQVQPTV